MTINRDTTLDIAKGISILMMTISHLDFFKKYDVIMDINKEALIIFKMPLFIFISGFLFSERKTLKEFSIQKFDGLIKPTFILYLFTTIAYILYYYYLDRDIKYAYRPVAYNYTALWFPIILFITQLILKFLINFHQNQIDKTKVFILFVSILLVLYFITQSNKNLPLIIITSILYFFIILNIGFFVKKKNLIKYIFDKKILVFSLIVFPICIFNSKLLNIKLNLYDNEFGLLIPTTITYLTGIIIVLNFSKFISRFNYITYILVKCSKASFFILAFHIVISNTIIYPFLINNFGENYIVDIITFVSTISLCIILYQLTFYTKFLKYLILPIKSFK